MDFGDCVLPKMLIYFPQRSYFGYMGCTNARESISNLHGCSFCRPSHWAYCFWIHRCCGFIMVMVVLDFDYICEHSSYGLLRFLALCEENLKYLQLEFYLTFCSAESN